MIYRICIFWKWLRGDCLECGCRAHPQSEGHLKCPRCGCMFDDNPFGHILTYGFREGFKQLTKKPYPR
jgi:hypothetical protein